MFHNEYLSVGNLFIGDEGTTRKILLLSVQTPPKRGSQIEIISNQIKPYKEYFIGTDSNDFCKWLDSMTYDFTWKARSPKIQFLQIKPNAVLKSERAIKGNLLNEFYNIDLIDVQSSTFVLEHMWLTPKRVEHDRIICVCNSVWLLPKQNYRFTLMNEMHIPFFAPLGKLEYQN